MRGSSGRRTPDEFEEARVDDCALVDEWAAVGRLDRSAGVGVAVGGDAQEVRALADGCASN
jgi:hypothetical protein